MITLMDYSDKQEVGDFGVINDKYFNQLISTYIMQNLWQNLLIIRLIVIWEYWWKEGGL